MKMRARTHGRHTMRAPAGDIDEPASVYVAPAIRRRRRAVSRAIDRTSAVGEEGVVNARTRALTAQLSEVTVDDIYTDDDDDDDARDDDGAGDGQGARRGNRGARRGEATEKNMRARVDACVCVCVCARRSCARAGRGWGAVGGP